jgi:hypothetical protein
MIVVFCIVTPCGLVVGNEYFVGTCCFHVQDRSEDAVFSLTVDLSGQHPSDQSVYSVRILTILTSVLKMEAECSSETLRSNYGVNSRSREDFKAYTEEEYDFLGCNVM